MQWTDPGHGRTQIINGAGEVVVEYCDGCGQHTDHDQPHLCSGWLPAPARRSDEVPEELTAERVASTIQRLEDEGWIKRRKKITSAIVLTPYARAALKRWADRPT